MRYRKLGRTGFEVSEMAHGLWGMGGWSGSDDRESLAALQLAIDLGCNCFDTAWAYGEGKSDGLLGEIMARNPAPPNPSGRLYAASKIPPLNRKWPGSAKNQYPEVFPAAHVFQHAEMIRKKLRTDSIDVLQFHVWDDSWADDPEFRRTVEKLKRDGTIRSFGLSLNRWEPENGLKALRTGLVDAVQVIYNIFDQAPEDKLFPVCQELNVGVIARVPLDEGSLGGKMTLETRFPKNDWRAMYFGRKNLPPTIERVEKLKAVLPPSMTLPEMSLRFILSNPVVSTIIVGMRKLDHVRQNIQVSDAGPFDLDLLRNLKAHRWDRKPQPWAD
ncbi:MAG TPA: aldo/keto reductase [Terriglobales bacterium]|jgi:aryl-alcohol dehydrogenase-like predicted oxidoreductase|nr:aldo/keto reductase [Terriglobales bacterium]